MKSKTVEKSMIWNTKLHELSRGADQRQILQIVLFCDGIYCYAAEI